MSEIELIEKIKNVTVILEGGDDSGSVNVTDVDNDDVKTIIEDLFYNESNYGSFAGSFSVYCEGSYDADNKQITITGTEENREDTILVNTIKYSKDISNNVFDSFNIYINADNESIDDLNFRLNIKNGIWKAEYDDLEAEITSELETILENTAGDSKNIDVNISLINKDKIEINIDCYNYDVRDMSFSVTVDEILERLNQKI